MKVTRTFASESDIVSVLTVLSDEEASGNRIPFLICDVHGQIPECTIHCGARFHASVTACCDGLIDRTISFGRIRSARNASAWPQVARTFHADSVASVLSR